MGPPIVCARGWREIAQAALGESSLNGLSAAGPDEQARGPGLGRVTLYARRSVTSFFPCLHVCPGDYTAECTLNITEYKLNYTADCSRTALCSTTCSIATVRPSRARIFGTVLTNCCPPVTSGLVATPSGTAKSHPDAEGYQRPAINDREHGFETGRNKGSHTPAPQLSGL